MALGQGFIKQFDDFINNVLLGPAADAIGGFVSKIASIGGSEVAGVSVGSGIKDGIRGMLGLEASPALVDNSADQPKVGRSADLYNGATLPISLDSELGGMPVQAGLPNFKIPSLAAGVSLRE